MPDNLDPKSTAGISRSKLLDVCDRLSEAEDFCRAIFMAAASLGDRGNTAGFQSLADIAKVKIRRSITELYEIRDDVEYQPRS
ncbi:hypothetical protein [Sinorhizobium meliloti]|uniref:hypothetical protein n=1 Tax=Rhizobium meliloti TaxID=382 RepID=UPI0013E2CE99|nr:hypothetical protein [Sinorhizobium meliloti]